MAKKWTCNHFSVTDHRGDASKLLRKAADAIEKMGKIDVLDIAFRTPAEPTFKEITATVYFSFRPQS